MSFRFRSLEGVLSIYLVDVYVYLCSCCNRFQWIYLLIFYRLLRCFSRFQWPSWSELKKTSTRDIVVERKDDHYLTQQLEQRIWALDRGEKIELLVDKIREPLFTGTRFQSARNENDRKMWFQNMKIKLIVLGIIIALILIILLSVCRGFNCA
ncbi:LOW QUALITY PROTEIN: uncharacterized protein LOC110229811 [Arabidopsis lyrata subsp. lyrata]|uniref:LOW QUALITY PROTEIN: uncharacterized protein LOC110229811 n=1 Tax=Arabidopsis lyrata subsp. lyrata TaxID=81972 RepID=UPI000A29C311|nr:LOW QUALITY PROTEIN: uncharacterized protein LOC110229811 [Arabidopsis lyrata subsp. lyrata]|eukprot:XP_020886440.1 LOW QUALITY PROTEIN: uncharacterized protein LOC110229811 [Arabidopsis lyrata subsp. lyrata]